MAGLVMGSLVTSSVAVDPVATAAAPAKRVRLESVDLLRGYLVWAFVVIALYPLCRWFAALKQRRSDAWLSYF